MISDSAFEYRDQTRTVPVLPAAVSEDFGSKNTGSNGNIALVEMDINSNAKVCAGDDPTIKDSLALPSNQPRPMPFYELLALATAAAAEEESPQPETEETSYSDEQSNESSPQPNNAFVMDVSVVQAEYLRNCKKEDQNLCEGDNHLVQESYVLFSSPSIKEKNANTLGNKNKISSPIKKKKVYKNKMEDSIKEQLMPPTDAGHSNSMRIVEATWRWNYENLVKYHDIHGDSNVLRSDPNKQLSGWVKRQRNNLKDGKLSPCKILLLNKLDFVWNRIDGKWYEKFNRLVEYQKKYGHCDVTAKYDRSLAEWTQRQRREYKNKLNSMTEVRIKKLEALQGWSWEKLKFRKECIETIHYADALMVKQVIKNVEAPIMADSVQVTVNQRSRIKTSSPNQVADIETPDEASNKEQMEASNRPKMNVSNLNLLCTASTLQPDYFVA
uniref:Helicase-associated domain-containing protein n=1 Tax=Pseudo-nitzschia australis TaxID=44445 RepID=A0A7S4AP64_9STRA|mmetsp:Transcript_17197/g.37622  ORF Transcript_17197/g.37622 Transcript_17197/m.37622 type:complete len:441 (+) Transcript_17197:105-1427(+)|eukprot:CAMPEP_0168304656 /NCGR_PEP_ID=MMETSP0142_2-20121227/47507_1 /TAXON_ID=44445 /ORGANISM="Pseudo-nitzschia australis, Strain 10249 10 AB" /LENGTH=440 /DNA_ID=CAMNT_0008255933 /DNA_START=58 /DNA_END=1380 /DNA_ORIENTATION=-